MPVYLDANVFVYAAGRPHPLKDPCVAILRRVEAGELVATTSAETLQELLHLYQRRGLATAGATLVRQVMALLPDILPVEVADIERAAALAETHADLPARDWVHAAVALRHGIATIISADRHFDGFDGLTRVDPMGSADQDLRA
jgi:predicted nucleic acid-binding protein